MLTTILCDEKNTFTRVENPGDISELIANPHRLVWLDLSAPTDEDFRLLGAEFKLHPLAIEDAMARHERPKVDQYDDFYFVVFYAVATQPVAAQQTPGRGLSGAHFLPFQRFHPAPRDSATDVLRPSKVRPAPPPASRAATAPRSFGHAPQLDAPEWTDDQIVLREISMFMGANYLITVHQEPIDELKEVTHRWQQNVGVIGGHNGATPAPAPATFSAALLPASNALLPASNGAAADMPAADTPVTATGIGILLYSLLDTIVDNYFPVVDAIVDRVEDLEEQIFERYNAASIESIFTLKKDLLALRKVLAPERDALNILSRRDLPLFDDRTLIYFQDVYDHVTRITDSIDTYRDLLSSALDSFLSMQSNRLNITVQTLTSASIILMVASVITGIYGTNFDNIPELHLRYGYYAMLAVILILSIVLLIFFKRRGWL